MEATSFLTLGVFLIVLGFVLLLGELFVTSGVLLVLSVASILVGIVFLFRYDTLVGIGGLIAVLVAIPLFGMLIVRMLPNTPLGQMGRPFPEEDGSDLPHRQELQLLRGRTGRTLTAMRPAGMVSFDGKRVDCVTEGMMIEAGAWVRCIDVQGGTVVVRPTDKPDTFTLETAQFN